MKRKIVEKRCMEDLKKVCFESVAQMIKKSSKIKSTKPHPAFLILVARRKIVFHNAVNLDVFFVSTCIT